MFHMLCPFLCYYAFLNALLFLPSFDKDILNSYITLFRFHGKHSCSYFKSCMYIPWCNLATGIRSGSRRAIFRDLLGIACICTVSLFSSSYDSPPYLIINKIKVYTSPILPRFVFLFLLGFSKPMHVLYLSWPFEVFVFVMHHIA